MALLFANVAKEYKSGRNNDDTVALSTQVSDLFDEIENTEQAKETSTMLPQKVFVTSVANEYYKKSIDEINNTSVGNKAVRRKNFQQIMKESFFYGANRFGNNFIA